MGVLRQTRELVVESNEWQVAGSPAEIAEATAGDLAGEQRAVARTPDLAL